MTTPLKILHKTGMQLLALVILFPSISIAETTFEARVTHIGKEHIEIRIGSQREQYELSNLFYPETKYYVNDRETTFGTLYGVGYIDKARITVEGKKVLRLEVIELYQ